MNHNALASDRSTLRLCRRTSLICVGALLVGSPSTLASQLLQVIPGQVSYSGGSAPIVDEMIYTLFYGGPQGPIPIPPWPVRYGELAVNVLADPARSFEEGASFAFNAMNTATFPEFAALATNGIADDILVGGIENAYTGGYGARTERLYGWSSSQSYELEEVRLAIGSLTFSPDRTAYWTDYHWEFLGRPVPEPGTWTAVSLFFQVILMPRRKTGHRT